MTRRPSSETKRKRMLNVDVVRSSFMKTGARFGLQRALCTDDDGHIVALDSPNRAGLRVMAKANEVWLSPRAVQVWYALLCLSELRRRKTLTEWEFEEQASELHAVFLRLVIGAE